MKIINRAKMTLHAFNLKHDIPKISPPFWNGYELTYDDGRVEWCPDEIYSHLQYVLDSETDLSRRVKRTKKRMIIVSAIMGIIILTLTIKLLS